MAVQIMACEVSSRSGSALDRSLTTPWIDHLCAVSVDDLNFVTRFQVSGTAVTCRNDSLTFRERHSVAVAASLFSQTLSCLDAASSRTQAPGYHCMQ